MWWDIFMSDFTSRLFFLKSKVEQVGASLGLPNPDVPHLLVIHFMDLDMVQDTGGSLMRILTTFQFTPIYYRNASSNQMSCSPHPQPPCLAAPQNINGPQIHHPSHRLVPPPHQFE